MNCRRCRKEFQQEESRCPHCGEPNPESWELYQTSTVLIAVSGNRAVYRSVEDVPARLRKRLMKSTNGANSATILIADRRGRREISRAMRNLPGSPQKRFMQGILGSRADNLPEWLTPARKRAVMALVLLLAIALIGLVFTRAW